MVPTAATPQSLSPQSDDPHYLHLMIQRSQSPEESLVVGDLQPPFMIIILVVTETLNS